MKKYNLLFVIMILSLTVFSQSTYYTITGKVTDKNSGAPLQEASVFAQNTTIGTATDTGGNFKLYLPNGGYDLIITFIGFETAIQRITTADTENKNILIQVKQKEKAMEAVSVVATNEVKDGWEKYGSFFTDNFIGKTTFSKSCYILNHEVLKFYFSKRRNRLKVLATAPIEIQNDALGYKIKYTLDSFTYEYAGETALYTGYPLFEEMQPQNEEQRSKWKINRQQAYDGSILHFMRSVYNKTLKEDGYEIQFLVKNNSADTAIELKNFYGALGYNKDDSTNTVEMLPNQQNIVVLYKKEPLPDDYIAAQTGEISKKFQMSVLSLAPQQAFVIEQNGYYYDQNDITITGYWIWEKVADMLPYDFKL